MLLLASYTMTLRRVQCTCCYCYREVLADDYARIITMTLECVQCTCCYCHREVLVGDPACIITMTLEHVQQVQHSVCVQ